ncbi:MULTISPECIES: lipase family protein [Escherichia]|uniref:lipase family protein n=1 Tax=Escherichia TaxID=561 RepID=UPI000CF7AEDD|nr:MULTISPECIES: lipase family protein [unclassified Escherichia]EFB2830829.1 lipase family protein [Escherichia coli]EFO2097333.1 lipase family protein [Escherichia coli]MBB2343870.1 lipase family protein [Escherichia sp. 93.0743]MBB2347906.1 lipase family protein [Escherichia sp. 92.1228]MCF7288135.1 lipase family protein [Escherichia coli]
MVGNTLVTSVTYTEEKATAGKQKPYWVEIQLVDEQGDPVANIPWRAESSHPVSGPVDNLTYTGQSEADGLIRIDMPHGLELRLALDGNQLATEMEKRALRVSRDAENDSVVRPEAEEKGYIWHYAVIGELCQSSPNLELRPGEMLPAYHFPANTAFKGFKFRTNELEKRHVIEICPFRSWELVLHHQKDYSIANGINLGAAATLAYANGSTLDTVSITRFFINQCQDLSRLPQLYKDGSAWNTLVQDVPYSNRYYPPVFMDTSRDTSPKVDSKNSHGTAQAKENTAVTKADGDTQLYYVYNVDKIIVAWRGTASLFDVGTDIEFRPVSPELCDINKTGCSTLLSAGKVHTGFWSGYSRVEKKFNKEILELLKTIESRMLFICGHSLGGALALIHAAKLKDYYPILYTYGMPRTFTRDAVMQLSEITHFRHVNDNDPIPAVPVEANLDNGLYKLWGWLGGTLGFFWSLGELLAYQMVTWGDCFWHHGNTVAFLTVTQSREWKECKRDLPTPAGCITIRKLLPLKAKLYLVPALAEQEMQQAGQKQKEFKASLTQADLTDFFPKGCNPDRGVNVNLFDHFMTSYMPYMYNKVLELIDNAGIVEKRTFTEHQYNVDSFREQMAENKNDIPESELVRNNIFLNIEGLLDASLSPTLFMPSGNDTLLRFAQYGEEVMENV